MKKRMSKVLILLLLGLGTASAQTSYVSTPQVLAQRNDCQTFKQTGKAVCGRFLQYWQTNGGLAQQGLPISDPMGEASATDGKVRTVQYFERAVFEYHPENKP